jgi:hypothetical protein
MDEISQQYAHEQLARQVDELEAENEQLRASLIQVRGFASVMAENNWRDLRLHIERQCDVLNQSVKANTEQ